MKDETGSEITIREAELGDERALLAITAKEYRSVSTDARIEDMIGGVPWLEVSSLFIRKVLLKKLPSGCFVAILDGRIVGYVTSVIDIDALRGVITTIAVSSDCRNRGIGRLLLNRALDHFRTLGLDQARIDTLTTNEVAAHLYASLGFKEVERQIHFAMSLSK